MENLRLISSEHYYKAQVFLSSKKGLQYLIDTYPPKTPVIKAVFMESFKKA